MEFGEGEEAAPSWRRHLEEELLEDAWLVWRHGSVLWIGGEDTDHRVWTLGGEGATGQGRRRAKGCEERSGEFFYSITERWSIYRVGIRPGG